MGGGRKLPDTPTTLSGRLYGPNVCCYASTYMLQLRRLLPAAVTLLLTPAILAQTATPLPPEVTARIDAAAEKQLAATGVPSASVAVVKDGKILRPRLRQGALDPPLGAPPNAYSMGRSANSSPLRR